MFYNETSKEDINSVGIRKPVLENREDTILKTLLDIFGLSELNRKERKS